jgi:hypothetical protein
VQRLVADCTYSGTWRAPLPGRRIVIGIQERCRSGMMGLYLASAERVRSMSLHFDESRGSLHSESGMVKTYRSTGLFR